MLPVHQNILEAEDFNLINGFRVVRSDWSFGDYVNVPNQGSAVMRTTVNDIPGVYDLVVYYWDENHGAGSSSVRIDGETVASWTWNQNLGSSMATSRTYTSRVIRDVEIRDGAVIEIAGQRVDKESMRIDKVVLAPPADRLDGTAGEAFPGAEGFGSGTAGGRGGIIVRVTNLNDSGVGSLRHALEDHDLPRIVVFDVGGVITLRSEISVNGDVTVAGQTAPGEGVTIRGSRLRVVEDDVIIRGLKFRPGDGAGTTLSTRDGISIGSVTTTVENVVIDGNSFSWGPDENIDVWYGSRNVTISNNIIAEGLRNNNRDLESFGVLIGDRSSNISVINNFFISNEFRNPTISDSTNVEVVNNYIYNYGQHAISFTMQDGYFMRGHVIGNYIEKGPDSGDQRAVRLVGARDEGVFYLDDNLSAHRTSSSMSESAVAGGALSTVRSNPVFTPSDVQAMSARDVKDYVLANAGARAQGLDDTDARLIAEALNGRGSLKTTPPSGSYSIPTVLTGPSDSDGDGIPNTSETSVGGDRSVFDPHADRDGDGYSNIEAYINGLIRRGAEGSGGTASPTPTPTPTPASVRIEAEDMRLVSTFIRTDMGSASGDQLIKGRPDVTARADHVFAGPDGEYDLLLRYVDENDGVAQAAIQRNGAVLASWSFNKNLGSSMVTSNTYDQRTISSVTLRTGDVISIVGEGDGGEPLWIDYLTIAPAADWG